MSAVALTLLGLGLLVALHELGHALSARALGLEVTDLSLGLGPSLLARRLGSGVTFRLGLIPFGGYVRVRELLPGSGDEPGRFAPGAVCGRLLVIAAGSVTNFAVAGALILVATLLFGQETGRIEGLEVTAGATRADAAGLLVGDVITHVSGRPVQQVAELSRGLAAGGGAEVPLTVRRGADVVELAVRPLRRGDRWGLGARYVAIPELRPAPLGAALLEGLTAPGRQALTLLDRWSQMLRPGRSEARPVSALGLADRVSRTGRWDLRRALGFAALLSVVVGLFNLLPLPSLDGGRLSLELVESLRRRRLAPRWAVAVQVAGAALLLVSWVGIVVGDLLHLEL